LTQGGCAEQGAEAGRRLAQALDAVRTEEGLLVKLGTLVYEAEEACTRTRAAEYLEAALREPQVRERLSRLGPRVVEAALAKIRRDPRYRQLRPYLGLLAGLLAAGPAPAVSAAGEEGLARLLGGLERLGPGAVFAEARLAEWSSLAPLYGEAALALAARGAPREAVAAVVAGLIRSAAWGPGPRGC